MPTTKPKKTLTKGKPPLVEIVAPKISLPPTTTDQEDIVTAGQRKINLIWEVTQAIIALLVTICTMVAGIMAVGGADPIPTILSVAFGTVVGFYFSRTNHSSIGGEGKKPSSPPYKGR